MVHYTTRQYARLRCCAVCRNDEHQRCSNCIELKLSEARRKSVLWEKPAFKPCPLLQRILKTEPDIAILVGDSRIESHSWFLQGLSPRLFKDLIAENFSPPRDGEPPFELDLTKADVALPDGVPEMLGPAIAFYRRYSDKEVLELLKQPENLEDFEGRFLPNALKLMTCGEFLGMGEEPPQEKGEGSAQGRAEGDGDDDDDDDEDEDEDDDDDDDDEDEDEDDGALELVRHVQHSVLKQMKKAWKWFCCNPDDGITEEPAGSSSITYDNENASYFEAALALLRACHASPRHCDAMATLEKQVVAELHIMIEALVHPCRALLKLLGTNCSQEPRKALLDTTIKRLMMPRHKGKILELAKYASTAEELASAIELLVEAEKPVDLQGHGRLITLALLKYASSHKEELEELSARSPSSYRVFKDHLDADKLTTEDLVENCEALIVLDPAKLAETQGRRLQLLKGHVEFKEDGDGGMSVHNPYKDMCEEMTTYRYKIPDSMLVEPYPACCEFIFLSNCLWELRVSPTMRGVLLPICLDLSVEIRPARPNRGIRDNTTNSIKYPSRLKYRLACGEVVVENTVSMPPVPDKGPIGWEFLTVDSNPIRMRPSELRGNTITLNAHETGKRKRESDSDGDLGSDSDESII